MSTGHPICHDCRHLQGVAPGKGWTCAAFEDGIPVDILASAANHRKPFPGDGGIQYQQRIAKAAGILFVVQDTEPRVLLLKRKDDEFWSLPGGIIEDAETAEETARREATEETGYEHKGDLILWTRRIYEAVDYTTFLARVEVAFAPVLNEEHDSWQWAQLSELL